MEHNFFDDLRVEGINQIREQRFTQALDSFKELVGKTQHSTDLRWQAMSNLMCEHYADALIDLHGVLSQEPNCAFSHLAIAFILSSSPNQQLRNGHLAVRHAMAGMDHVKEPTWRTYSILCAAYAEDGEFEKAAEEAQRMLDAAPEHFRETAKRRIGDCALGLTYTATLQEIRESMGFLEYTCSQCDKRTFVVWMGEDGCVERLCNDCQSVNETD